MSLIIGWVSFSNFTFLLHIGLLLFKLLSIHSICYHSRLWNLNILMHPFFKPHQITHFSMFLDAYSSLVCVLTLSIICMLVLLYALFLGMHLTNVVMCALTWLLRSSWLIEIFGFLRENLVFPNLFFCLLVIIISHLVFPYCTFLNGCPISFW